MEVAAAAASTDAGSARSPANKQNMFETFQAWANQNYGDSGKTKTVTRRKYLRIVRILTGEEVASSENSKFRFWVKAKGLLLGQAPPGDAEKHVLYVPAKQKGEQLDLSREPSYKRVAIVEDFFHIIYNVHVEMDGRGGKHAGQKRTYRAIAETYAFLPREAVTRFLMSCADCQKRMHLTTISETNNNHTETEATNNASDAPIHYDPPIIDFSMPITNSYLAHIRSTRPAVSTQQPVFPSTEPFHNDKDDSMSSGIDSELSICLSPPQPDESVSPKVANLPDTRNASMVSFLSNGTSEAEKPVVEEGAKQVEEVPVADQKLSPPLTLKTEGGTSHPERKRRASDASLDSSVKTSENADDSVSRDDDEDEEEDDDKSSVASDVDVERLKAFNMFVRLFVDENLDRMVPISKQPKDKVQAILDACDRQFPEFHERSRKRVRTYLKSCRRMRRSKDNNWEQLRPTPPHLTSAAAESLLAQACENEANNAKRMRMGLDPLPCSTSGNTRATPAQPAAPTTSTSPATAASALHQGASTAMSSVDYLRSVQGAGATPSSSGFRTPHDITAPFPFAAAAAAANGPNGLFRPGFSGSFSSTNHLPVIQHTTLAAQLQQNGPTDLSMKNKTSPGSKPTNLSSSEIATIKQLIAGYRESASFLYRSAEELEQLLLQHN